jgi:uncharacterized membrane protein
MDMTYLLLGLLLFLGIHCTRIFADGLRTRAIARIGDRPWKLLYTVISFAGLGLIIWGYAQARQSPVVLYTPPHWTYWIAAALMLLSFILIVAAYVPGNHFKAKLGHPMLAGTKLWAFAHLISNGTLADVALFGGFLAWAVLNFTSMRRRDRAAGKTYRPGTIMGDLIALAIGGIVWVAFAFWAHAWLFGVKPL